MLELIDRAISIAKGLEEKTKGLLKELEDAGKKSPARTEAEKTTTTTERLENKVVEEGTKALKELITTLTEAKDKLSKEINETAESLLARLNVATRSDLEVVEEMVRVAREKVDKLEKRLAHLEGHEGKK
ncbi:MAG: accessory factor UbiK family protein [Deltaproteobacteria bacterium]|nr:accessory factor UbiK family protein [Deltaproteobacteria bacterium]